MLRPLLWHDVFDGEISCGHCCLIELGAMSVLELLNDEAQPRLRNCPVGSATRKGFGYLNVRRHAGRITGQVTEIGSKRRNGII